jgi:dipeptidyl aminopeptidase/acylaminoacyl peptidase
MLLRHYSVAYKALTLAVVMTVGVVIGSIVATEGALHIHQRPRPNAAVADAIARETNSRWEQARVSGRDGAHLDGWVFTPARANGGGAIVLHGVGDTREGMTDHVRLLVRAGYTVLDPDCRGHGVSGGDVISYGVREADDVHTWCDWLVGTRGVRRLYGVGRSMGAAILLESIPREPRLRAVVAECPFENFEEVAYYRLGQASHAGRFALWPVIHAGFGYARVRYGMNLWSASPMDAVRHAATPILLIHGTGDTNIPPVQSEHLHAVNPGATTLWLVPGAGHVGSMAVDPAGYEQRVIEFLGSH